MKLRIRSIYTKLLLSFFALLAAAVMLMALWYLVFMADTFMEEDMLDASAQGKLLGLALREAAATAPDTPPHENPRIQNLIREFAEYYEAEGWLLDTEGMVRFGTHGMELPQVQPESTYDLETLIISELAPATADAPAKFYVIVPAELGQWGSWSLHAMFDDYHTATGLGRKFFSGQIAVVALIALLVFPVSRFITTPLRRLQQAVHRYGEGDLTSRFTEHRGDEIGELGRAFNRMADSLQRMIRGGRELVANVSHELRSPLTRLRISEELLRSKLERDATPHPSPDNADRSRHLDVIRDEVEHLDGLIGRMLELTRLDLDDSEARFEVMDLSDLVRRMAARYDTLTEHHDLAFTVMVEEGLKVRGIPDGLASVLTNLLDNGFKYCTPSGEVHLKLDAGKPGMVNMIRLCVTNTHPSLAPTDLEAIFRPFYRAPGMDAQGYGLGLALVRKIVHRHGGQIHAENSETGLRMEVTLPRAG